MWLKMKQGIDRKYEVSQTFASHFCLGSNAQGKWARRQRPGLLLRMRSMKERVLGFPKHCWLYEIPGYTKFLG